jgi:hypothetical protein
MILVFQRQSFKAYTLPAMLIPLLRRCIVTPGTPQPKTLVLPDKLGLVTAPDGFEAGRLFPILGGHHVSSQCSPETP